MKAILATIRSDSHTWNLIFMQLWLEERGFEVINLGSCTEEDAIVKASIIHCPKLIIISTVNGHGMSEAPNIIKALRQKRSIDSIRLIIGGQLTTNEATARLACNRLLKVGYDLAITGSGALRVFDQWIEFEFVHKKPIPIYL